MASKIRSNLLHQREKKKWSRYKISTFEDSTYGSQPGKQFRNNKKMQIEFHKFIVCGPSKVTWLLP